MSTEETFIFFDVDGVLIHGFHSDPRVRQRWDVHLEQELGISSTELTREFFEKDFLSVITGKEDLYSALERVLPKLNPEVSPRDLVDYWFANDGNINHELFDHVKTLAAQPDLKLFIATNQEAYRARYLWQILGFKDHFEDIFYSGRMGCLKRDPVFFAQINRTLDLGQKNVIFFDDSADNMAPALAAGWDAVLYKETAQVTGHPKLAAFFSA